jgi:hypothetical protein
VITLCGYIAGALAKLALSTTGHALPPVFWLTSSTVSVGMNVVLNGGWEAPRRADRTDGGALVGVLLGCPTPRTGRFTLSFSWTPGFSLAPSFAGAEIRPSIHRCITHRADGTSVAIHHTFTGARGSRSALRQPSSVVRGVPITSSGITAKRGI